MIHRTLSCPVVLGKSLCYKPTILEMQRRSPFNTWATLDVSGVFATRRLLQRLCCFWPRWRWENYPRWAEAVAWFMRVMAGFGMVWWVAARDISYLKNQVHWLVTSLVPLVQVSGRFWTCESGWWILMAGMFSDGVKRPGTATLDLHVILRGCMCMVDC